MNIIFQCFAVKLELKFIKNMKLSQFKWINKQIMFYYKVY